MTVEGAGKGVEGVDVDVEGKDVDVDVVDVENSLLFLCVCSACCCITKSTKPLLLPLLATLSRSFCGVCKFCCD